MDSTTTNKISSNLHPDQSRPITAADADVRMVSGPHGRDVYVHADGRIFRMKDDGTLRVISPYWAWTSRRGRGQGYLRVDVRGDGPRWRPRVHILVCSAFHGPRPSPDHEVRHLNDDRADNRSANLAWGLPSDNVRDALANGRIHRGVNVASAKLTDDKVAALRSEYERTGNLYAAMVATSAGVSRTAARYAVTGRTWKHVAGASAVNNVTGSAA